MKTGFTVGPGGATAALGVTPDITCLAKSVGGGLVLGAVGGSAEVMEHVANDDYEMVGTFNGNPLSLSAARAMVYEIATPEAYARLANLRQVVDRELGALIAEHGLPAQVVSIGAKGCVTFSTEPVRNYRDFLGVDDRYNHAHWLMQHNGGVFLPPWGKTEQWLMSVQHTPRRHGPLHQRTSPASLQRSVLGAWTIPCGWADRVIDSLIECSVRWRPTSGDVGWSARFDCRTVGPVAAQQVEGPISSRGRCTVVMHPREGWIEPGVRRPVSRRQFLAGAGGALAVGGLGGLLGACSSSGAAKLGLGQFRPYRCPARTAR